MSAVRLIGVASSFLGLLGVIGCDETDPTPTFLDGGLPFDGAMSDAAGDAPAACVPMPTNCAAPLPLTNAELAGDKTLPAGTCYVANQNLRVDSGTLTLAPGVVIQFATGTALSVKTGGQLKLMGTCEAPVRLTSTDPVASWKGVEMDDTQGSNNAWTYAVIDNAGSGQWTGASYTEAAVYLSGTTTLTMDHVSIVNSKAHGLMVLAGVNFTFANGKLEGNVTPAYLHPQAVGRIPADTVVMGNTNPYIRVVFGNTDSLTGAATWAPHLYRIEERFSVNGDLTLSPGAKLQFAQGVSMLVDTGATLTAKGSAEMPIVFSGAANTKGFWKGIEVRSGGVGNPVTVGATFDHCVIEDAGGAQWSGAADSRAALYLDSTSAAAITNTTFRNSAHYGLWASDDARLPGFAMNTFVGNARVMMLHPDRVGELSGTSTLTGNEEDVIRVVFGNTDKVSVAATWKSPGVPYWVMDRLNVEATLTIEAGVNIRFAQDRGMIVDAAGSLTTNGTAAAPVNFSGQNAVATGYWQGIRFESNNPQNVLNFTTIAHAGSTRWTGAATSDAAIYVDDGAQVSLKTVTLGPGGGHGVSIASGMGMLSCMDVTFGTLAKGPVYNRTAPPGVVTMCP